MKRRFIFGFIVIVVIYWITHFFRNDKIDKSEQTEFLKSTDSVAVWKGLSAATILNDTYETSLIKYGYELIAHTSKYLGPNGTVSHSTNGMNCQNCHLEAGTKPWGINYGSVYSTYPKFRERSGTKETIYKRINDCMERSLNGQSLDSNSKEMKAIYSYLQWLGKEVPKGKKVKGSGIEILPYLKVAADPKQGKLVYIKNCQVCHSLNGEGKMDTTGKMFLYPPLWGKHSYNDAAGIYQISKLAGFIKNNMPNGINYQTPLLSNQDCWNVAAYINSQPRPSKDKSKDWPKLATKPIDYPFGPYTDTFSTNQHKYGPFDPILAAKK